MIDDKHRHLRPGATDPDHAIELDDYFADRSSDGGRAS